MKASHFSSDVQEFLFLLQQYEVKYVIIGGEAVIYYGNPRLTGDIDFYYQVSDKNVKALYNALLEFWDEDIPGSIGPVELAEPDAVIQFGVPPNRIDLLSSIECLDFDNVWRSKRVETVSLKNR